jgi:hypothetical protein
MTMSGAVKILSDASAGGEKPSGIFGWDAARAFCGHAAR